MLTFIDYGLSVDLNDISVLRFFDEYEEGVIVLKCGTQVKTDWTQYCLIREKILTVSNYYKAMPDISKELKEHNKNKTEET